VDDVFSAEQEATYEMTLEKN